MALQKNKGSILLKIVLVLLVLAAAGFIALQQIRPVARVKAANRQDAADAVTGTVSIDPEGGTREFKSEADGKVIWCDALKQSAHFKKGDKLMELDTTELKRGIADAQRTFDYAARIKRFELTGGKPELLENLGDISDDEMVEKLKTLSPTRKLVVKKLTDAKKMLELNAASAEDVRALERELENLDNGLRRTVLEDKKNQSDHESAVKASDEQLIRMTIFAPSDGQIDIPQTWVGQMIGRGQVISTWFSNERVVAAKISEESFAKVRVGQKARLRLLTQGQDGLDAEVSKIHPKADEAQRFTVFLKVKTDHPEDVLKPGSTGEVVITIQQRPNALMIQRRALFDSDKVLVVKNGKVEKRKVEVGFVNLNVVEIVNGLKEGEQVIVDDLDRFHDGRSVQVEVVK